MPCRKKCSRRPTSHGHLSSSVESTCTTDHIERAIAGAIRSTISCAIRGAIRGHPNAIQKQCEANEEESASSERHLDDLSDVLVGIARRADGHPDGLSQAVACEPFERGRERRREEERLPIGAYLLQDGTHLRRNGDQHTRTHESEYH